MIGRRWIRFTAAAVIAAGSSATATNIGVAPKKIVIVDQVAAAGKAKVVFVAKDPSVTKGSGIDASQITARLTIAYGNGTSAGSFTLPVGASDATSGWLSNKQSVAKYRNKSAPTGPTEAKISVVKPDKLLKLVAKGLGDTPLDILNSMDPGLSGLFTSYCITNGVEENCHCSVFTDCTFKNIAGGTGAKLRCKTGQPDNLCVAESACPGGTPVSSTSEILALTTGESARIAAPIPVTSTVSLPTGVDLCFMPTGRLVLDSAVELTVNGDIHAGPWQIFTYADDTSSTVGLPGTEILPAWWGATVDDASNDTAPLRYAGDFISRSGSGTIQFRPGTYIVGAQSQPSPPSFKLEADEVLFVKGTTGPVVVEGNGAILRAADGLHYGYFDPATGDPIDPTSDCGATGTFAANTYWGMLHFVNNPDITVRDLELDGNSGNYLLGGICGAEGRQVASNGIRAYRNDSFVADNVYTHHHGADGIIIGYTGLTEIHPPTPHTVTNLISEYNGRQGMSWVGGLGLTVQNSRFAHTGRAGIASPPGAGLDIEVEDSQLRNGLFEDCVFLDNSGPGVTADIPNPTQGDAKFFTFRRSTFHGTTTWSVIARRPGMVFEDCIFHGAIPNSYSTAVPAEGLRFTRCHFEDPFDLAFPVYRGASNLLELDGDNTLIEDSTIIAHGARALWFDGITTQETIRDTTVVHGDDLRADGTDWQSLLRGVTLDNVQFNEDFDTPPTIGWWIIAENVTTTNVCLSGPWVKWGSLAGPTGCLP